MTQSALAKERRELREQQQRTALEAIPKDLSRPWEDPLPEPGERHLAQVPTDPSIQEIVHANVHIDQVHHDISSLLKLRASAWRAMRHPSSAVESLTGRI